MKPWIEVADHTGTGFAPVWRCGNWRLAVSNDGSAFHRENITSVAKHLETDETFTLLSGRAFLHYGDGDETPGQIRKVELEQGKTLVVRAGVWHAVETCSGAKLLIVENADTGAQNTVQYKISGADLP